MFLDQLRIQPAQIETNLPVRIADFGDGPLKPFVAGGIGLAKFHVNIDSPVTGSDSDLVLAGSLAAGANYVVSPHAELFAAAEVLLLNDVTLDPTGGGSAKLLNPMFLSLAVGLRWNF